MSLIVTFLGFLLGTLCAVASISKYRFLRIIVAIYVEAIRNTPLLIQLFLVYFGLSSLGLKFSAQASALIGLTINVGAYSSEIIRAGLQSINKGQLEAADTLGLSRLQMLAAVMLPPALERVYPSLVSQYVLLMLATSVASDFCRRAHGAAARIQSITFRSFEVYLVILVIYLLLSFLMRGLFKLLALGFFPANAALALISRRTQCLHLSPGCMLKFCCKGLFGLLFYRSLVLFLAVFLGLRFLLQGFPKQGAGSIGRCLHRSRAGYASPHPDVPGLFWTANPQH